MAVRASDAELGTSLESSHAEPNTALADDAAKQKHRSELLPI
jgi:hypothetical protein